MNSSDGPSTQYLVSKKLVDTNDQQADIAKKVFWHNYRLFREKRKAGIVLDKALMRLGPFHAAMYLILRATEQANRK